MQNTPREWQLLRHIKNKVQRHHPHTVVGLGDDAFVFRNFPGNSAICQDMMIEGTHFDLDYFSAEDLGHKALAVNLSDLAAMGALPHFVQVSLGIPEKINESWLDQFYSGMCELADKFDCEIVGGDLCQSPHLVIDVSLHGSVAHPLPRRHQGGPHPGDILLSSGPLGLSHVGLWALQNKAPGFPQGKQRHLRPQPRLDLLTELQEKSSAITALMDCSDGLINDALQLSSGRGLIIESESLQHTEITDLAGRLNCSPEKIILWGGEDFELLVSVRPEQLSLFSEWKKCGVWQREPGFYLQADRGLKKIERFEGWTHF